MIHRATHATALHQAGRRDEAEARFRGAEEMQAEQQPKYPLLYSIRGFQYCELLLAAAERAAWRRMVPSSATLSLRAERSNPEPRASAGSLRFARDDGPETLEALIDSCRAVSRRAAKMFDWRLPSDSLLDIALDHLTLGRAALYAAVLEGKPLDQLEPCREALQHAVDGLRRAGMLDYLPPGLLTRAWLRFLAGARTGPDSAQCDLDEAWEVAERGPMPLFMADIHLHRARLLGLSKNRTPNYPWTSPQDDLAEARDLIEKHGYGRRKEELEDAEAAALAVADTHRVR